MIQLAKNDLCENSEIKTLIENRKFKLYISKKTGYPKDDYPGILRYK